MEEEKVVQTEQKHPPKKRANSAASYLAKVALFSALAYVLRLVKFPIPFLFAPWLELHFADFPALIGGFALGPVACGVITFVSVLLKMLTAGSATGYVGDFANLLTGLALVLPAALIYRKYRSRKGALIGAITGSVCSIIISIPANRYMLVPFYAGLFGFDEVVGMFSSLFPSVTAENFYNLYIWASVIPFNIIRCLAVALLTFIIYKRISNLLNKF